MLKIGRPLFLFKSRLKGRYFPFCTWDIKITGRSRNRPRKGDLVQPKWQVLNGGGMSTSLLLRVPGANYLFNCGEGTERMIWLLKLGGIFAKSCHIFITSKSWRNIGGLPSVCLVARRKGASQIFVHGPPGTTEIHQITGNPLLDRGELSISMFDRPTYEDPFLTVQDIKLSRVAPLKRPRHHVSWQSEIRNKIRTALRDDGFYKTSVHAYLCTYKDNGSSTLVVEIPDREYLPELALLSTKKLGNLNQIIHLTPPHILQEEAYIDWIKGMSQGQVQHVFVGTETRPEGWVDREYHSKLTNINPSLFPPLAEQSAPLFNRSISRENLVDAAKGSKIETGRSRGTNTAGSYTYLNQYNSNNYDGHKEPTEPTTREETRSNEVYPEITFLGTANNAPNNYRNVSCIVVEVEKDHFLMLDCGEGSLAQLLTLYGESGVENVLLKLKCIFISHQHTDHHMGVNSVLQARQAILKSRGVGDTKLFIICSGLYAYMLLRYHTQVQPLLEDIVFINSRAILHTNPKQDRGDNSSQPLDNNDLRKDRDGSSSQPCDNAAPSQERGDNSSQPCDKTALGQDRGKSSSQPCDDREKDRGKRSTQRCDIKALYQDRVKSISLVNRNTSHDNSNVFNDCDDKQTLGNAGRNVNRIEDDVPVENRVELYNISSCSVAVDEKKNKADYEEMNIKDLLSYCSLSEMQTCEAKHSVDAYSISFRTAAGYRITYSGDTRPNPALVKLGRNSDLLIHEATYCKSMAWEAVLAKHSTTTEAAQQGERMRAKVTLLTHFQRLYEQIPLLDDLEEMATVGVAFDFMVVNRGNLHTVPAMLQLLKVEFKDELKRIRRVVDKWKNTSGKTGEIGEVSGEVPEKSTEDGSKTAISFMKELNWKTKKRQTITE